MSIISEWASRWGISQQAIQDLYQSLLFYEPSPPKKFTEADNLRRIRLEASRKGKTLFRNNVGGYKDERGNFIRYGLANDSKQMNKKLKSSDLIGVTPVTITPDMVGGVIGQFTAIEVKKSGWRFRGTEEEEAQAAFITLVLLMGGYAAFANGEGSL